MAGPHLTCLAYWLSYNKSKTLMCVPHPLTIGRDPHPSLTLMLIGAATCALQAETMNDLQARHMPHHRSVLAPALHEHRRRQQARTLRGDGPRTYGAYPDPTRIPLQA